MEVQWDYDIWYAYGSECIFYVVEWSNCQINRKLEICRHQFLQWQKCIVEAWTNTLPAVSTANNTTNRQKFLQIHNRYINHMHNNFMVAYVYTKVSQDFHRQPVLQAGCVAPVSCFPYACSCMAKLPHGWPSSWVALSWRVVTNSKEGTGWVGKVTPHRTNHQESVIMLRPCSWQPIHNINLCVEKIN